MKSNLEQYLVSRLKGLLEEVLTFDTRLYEDHTKERTLAQKIIEFKKSNPDAQFSDVKTDLVEYRKLGFNNSLLLQDYYRSLEVLKELYNTLTIHNIDAQLDETQKNFLEQVSKNYMKQFTVDKGEIVYIDKEVEKNLNHSLSIDSDATYEAVFHSPRLSQIN